MSAKIIKCQNCGFENPLELITNIEKDCNKCKFGFPVTSEGILDFVSTHKQEKKDRAHFPNV